jgi:hypothetical protein
MTTNMKNLLIILIVSIGAAGVLMVSMSRASLETMAKDEREGVLRVEPVIVQGKTIYKLPQTNMLPNNVFYGIKEMRDWLWRKFSVGNEKEAKIMLILADKRIAEARSLANRGKYKIAIETGIRAVDKLKYARELVEEMENQDTSQEQLIVQIREAASAYDEIIKEIGQKDGSGNQKYIFLQQSIDDFKKEQIQEKTIETN